MLRHLLVAPTEFSACAGFVLVFDYKSLVSGVSAKYTASAWSRTQAIGRSKADRSVFVPTVTLEGVLAALWCICRTAC